jgi:hypothetical protein
MSQPSAEIISEATPFFHHPLSRVFPLPLLLALLLLASLGKGVWARGRDGKEQRAVQPSWRGIEHRDC